MDVGVVPFHEYLGPPEWRKPELRMEPMSITRRQNPEIRDGCIVRNHAGRRYSIWPDTIDAAAIATWALLNRIHILGGRNDAIAVQIVRRKHAVYQVGEIRRAQVNVVVGLA